MLLWSRLCAKITQTFEFVGVMRVKPQLGENRHGIIKLCGLIKNWWTLGRVLGFSPRVLWFEVP